MLINVKKHSAHCIIIFFMKRISFCKSSLLYSLQWYIFRNILRKMKRFSALMFLTVFKKFCSITFHKKKKHTVDVSNCTYQSKFSLSTTRSVIKRSLFTLCCRLVAAASARNLIKIFIRNIEYKCIRHERKTRFHCFIFSMSFCMVT